MLVPLSGAMRNSNAIEPATARAKCLAWTADGNGLILGVPAGNSGVSPINGVPAGWRSRGGEHAIDVVAVPARKELFTPTTVI